MFKPSPLSFLSGDGLFLPIQMSHRKHGIMGLFFVLQTNLFGCLPAILWHLVQQSLRQELKLLCFFHFSITSTISPMNMVWGGTRV